MVILREDSSSQELMIECWNSFVDSFEDAHVGKKVEIQHARLRIDPRYTPTVKVQLTDRNPDAPSYVEYKKPIVIVK